LSRGTLNKKSASERRFGEASLKDYLIVVILTTILMRQLYIMKQRTSISFELTSFGETV